MTMLTCMRGYPGSGKSTIARSLPGVVVGRDYLRHQMYGQYVLTGDQENAVTIAERAQVTALLTAGHDVIVDDMNLNPRYLRDWAKLARDLDVEFQVWNVPTSAETCIKRDASAERLGLNKAVGVAVIKKLAKKWPIDKWPPITLKAKPTAHIKTYIPNPFAPDAIIVDIDGTLAHMNGRSPYDYSLVHTDTVDKTIRDISNHEHARGTRVILCSGRDSACRAETIKWLIANGIWWDELFMRPDDDKGDDGNKLPDWIVKLDLFDTHIRHNYNVKWVLDDRNQVVAMWRQLGLKCLQVEPGDF